MPKPAKAPLPATVAVLTGDVVASSALGAGARRELPALLATAARQLKAAFGRATPYDLEIFRGDSWQLVVTDPAQCFRAALFFRACVIAESRERRLDTRVAIAVGAVDFLPRHNVSAGDGPAYRASGEALDRLDAASRLALVGPGEQPWRDVAVRLVDAIVQEWTARQARAVAGRLRHWTQQEIATHWPERITQQSVARHLARSHWAAIEPAARQIGHSLQPL